MNYPYAPQYQKRSNMPRFLSILIGFASAFIVGIFFGLSASFFYALIGQKGGLECLVIPIVTALLSITAAIAFFITHFVDKKIRRGN